MEWASEWVALLSGSSTVGRWKFTLYRVSGSLPEQFHCSRLCNVYLGDRLLKLNTGRSVPSFFVGYSVHPFRDHKQSFSAQRRPHLRCMEKGTSSLTPCSPVSLYTWSKKSVWLGALAGICNKFHVRLGATYRSRLCLLAKIAIIKPPCNPSKSGCTLQREVFVGSGHERAGRAYYRQAGPLWDVYRRRSKTQRLPKCWCAQVAEPWL